MADSKQLDGAYFSATVGAHISQLGASADALRALLGPEAARSLIAAVLGDVTTTRRTTVKRSHLEDVDTPTARRET